MPKKTAPPRREVRLKTSDITADISDTVTLKKLDAVATLKGTTRTAILASLVATALGPRFTKHITAV